MERTDHLENSKEILAASNNFELFIAQKLYSVYGAAGSSFSRGKPADSVVAEMFFFLRVCMWKEERLTIARQKNNFFLYGLWI